MQPTEKINLREERNLGEKLNATFGFISQNFKSLSGVIFYLCAPPLIICGIGYSTFFATFFRNVTAMRYMQNTGVADIFMNSGLAFAIIAIFIMMMVAYSLVPLVCYCYLKIYYQQMDIAEITANDVWKEVKPRLLPVIGWNMLLLLMIIVSCFFFIVPGIYFGIVFSLFNVVYVMEEQPFGETLSRCFALIKGKWWSTFGIILVCGLVVNLIGIIFQIPVWILTMASAFMKWDVADILTVTMVSNTFSIVAQMMFMSITLIGLGFQYFNLAERLDGTGMRELIASIGTNKTLIPDEGEY